MLKLATKKLSVRFAATTSDSIIPQKLRRAKEKQWTDRRKTSCGEENPFPLAVSYPT
ncbi:MAG: hypothetical protein IJW57_12300 [Spirochaetaceae bacterium]|nr:hypothetical protein [Spirochaetaceae bacterium]